MITQRNQYSFLDPKMMCVVIALPSKCYYYLTHVNTNQVEILRILQDSTTFRITTVVQLKQYTHSEIHIIPLMTTMHACSTLSH